MKKLPGLHYVIALIVACVIIAVGVAFVRQTWNEMRTRFKQGAAMKKPGGQPLTAAAEADLDALFDSGSFGVTLPTSMQVRLDISQWLESFWFVFVPLTFMVCLGAAAVFGWLRGRWTA